MGPTEKGARVRVTRLAVSPGGHDDNPRYAGQEGTVTGYSRPTSVTPTGQVWVKFDNGGALALLPGRDQWEAAS